MHRFKNSFAWQFAGGFVLGALGLLAFQPATAQAATAQPVEHGARPAIHAVR